MDSIAATCCVMLARDGSSRKSGGTWLTTRAALSGVLIVELAGEARGRPRAQSAAWAEVTMTPELEDILARIDRLRAGWLNRCAARSMTNVSAAELIVEAIYHTNHLEGNQLSLPEVRAVVEAFWVETNGHGGISQDEQSAAR
ncbi:hypothetical protein [Candidatus Amarolinea dominans]|uniref:hypothetical protein n=1 Tax=Candidatus Amarolinea dominans TaxID=3140696 RepID=UPI001DE3D9A0|nr:hypothetical protein [Anaerolineae bacterium]